ncbi:MAG: RluA family pseudouridine synthase [Stappiaceae bacterium]
MAAIESRNVEEDEEGMRLDRWFKAHFPELAFGQLQKLLRTGQIRVDGGRAKTSQRLEEGQAVRIPPMAAETVKLAPEKVRPRKISKDDREAIESMILHEDKAVMVLNKAPGLAVQGGSGMTRHVDGMLEAFRDKSGNKPRLVHRLDRDTSGVLVIAKTRRAAQELTKAFRARATRKVYWALLKGVPTPRQGKISNYLARLDNEFMRVAKHGEPEAQHALTHYNVVETSGQALSWVTLKPVTGRTHQLRIQCQSIGNPIVGDPKYFDVENWELPGGMQNKLHLLARRIVIPHPAGGTLDISAPLPPHMQQSWNLLGFDIGDYDREADLTEGG